MNKFKIIRSLYQTELIRNKTEFKNIKYTELAKECTKNCKRWWSLLKTVYKNCDMPDQIPPIEVNGNQITDDKEKANVFKNYFASISSFDGDFNLPDEPIIIRGDTLESITVTNQDILDQLKMINVNKAYGIDEISPRLLKESGNALCEVLKDIYNRSLEMGKCPKIGKTQMSFLFIKKIANPMSTIIDLSQY